MKKFILGYLIGSFISSMATDYLVRTEIFMKLAQRKKEVQGYDLCSEFDL